MCVDTVGVWGPIGIGVLRWFAKQAHVERTGCKCHEVACAPHGGDGREKERYAKEIIVQIIQLAAIFPALGFDHAHGG